jgi:hypothetical protein
MALYDAGAVNHPEAAGFWRGLAISEAQFKKDDSIPSEEIKYV